MHQFGVDYALKRLLTDEFRNLVNQEYNLLLFMEGQRFEAFARSLYEDLEAHRKNLEKE